MVEVYLLLPVAERELPTGFSGHEGTEKSSPWREFSRLINLFSIGRKAQPLFVKNNEIKSNNHVIADKGLELGTASGTDVSAQQQRSSLRTQWERFRSHRQVKGHDYFVKVNNDTPIPVYSLMIL